MVLPPALPEGAATNGSWPHPSPRERRENLQKSPALRYLVIGGSGCVGSHLCDRLTDVPVLDDQSTGRVSTVEHPLESSRIEFVQAAVCSPVRHE